MVPAPGQGALMLQARTGDAETATAAAGVSDRESLVEFTAERAATGALEATCDTPLGLCARHMDGTLAVADTPGCRTEASGSATPCAATPSSLPPSARHSPSACSRRAPGRSSSAPQRAS